MILQIIHQNCLTSNGWMNEWLNEWVSEWVTEIERYQHVVVFINKVNVLELCRNLKTISTDGCNDAIAVGIIHRPVIISSWFIMSMIYKDRRWRRQRQYRQQCHNDAIHMSTRHIAQKMLIRSNHPSQQPAIHPSHLHASLHYPRRKALIHKRNNHK